MDAYSKELQCHWMSVAVESEGGLEIQIPWGECCDMAGAIEFAWKIMPEVRFIQTVVGGKNDTAYWKHFKRGWIAIPPEKPVAHLDASELPPPFFATE